MEKCSIFSYSVILGLYINEAFCLPCCAKTSKSIHLAGASRHGEAQKPAPFLLIFYPLLKTEWYLPMRMNLRTGGGLCISSAGPDHCSLNKPSLLSVAPQQSPTVAVSFNCRGVFKCPFCNLRLISHFTLKIFYYLGITQRQSTWLKFS